MDGHPRPANLVQNWTSRVARHRAERATALNLLTDARAKAAQQRQYERVQDTPDHAISWPVRILTATVALAVLAVVAVIATVVIGTQVGFYVTNLRVRWVDFSGLGIPRPLDLTLFTPIATESIVWACTLMAVVLVLLNRSSVLWTRAMWLFSGIAAFVNSWHAIHEESDFFGGIVKGGLSVAGPIVVHLFILWVRHLRTGKSLEQARADVAIRWGVVGRALLRTLIVVGQHLRHPTIAARATGYYLGIQQWGYRESWSAASLDYRKRVAARLTGSYRGPVARFLRSRDTSPPGDPDATGSMFPVGTDAALVSDRDVLPVPAADRGDAIDLLDVDVDDLISKLLGRPVDDPDASETATDQHQHATETDATEAAQNATGEATGPAETATRSRLGRRPGRRPKATGTTGRTRRTTRPAATDVDVSDILPVAREVARDLSDRGELTRDRLLTELRVRGHSAGPRRRNAVWQKVTEEMGRS